MSKASLVEFFRQCLSANHKVSWPTYVRCLEDADIVLPTLRTTCEKRAKPRSAVPGQLMIKSSFAKGLFALVSLSMSGFVYSNIEEPAEPKVKPPNIVVMLADDLGWADLSSPLATSGYGSKYYETPNIDKLAQQGMSFTRAYTQQNCQPTRAALISGQYAPGQYNDTYNVVSLGRWNEDTEEWPTIKIAPYDQGGNVSPESVSLFEMAKQAGYTTAWFGKNHGTGKPEQLGINHGIDHNFASKKNLTAQVNGKKVNTQFLALKDDNKGWVLDKPLIKYAQPYSESYVKNNLLPHANGNDPLSLVGTAKHYSDALTDAVVDFLTLQSEQADPFVAYIPFHAVHSKIVPRKDMHEKYKQKTSDDPRHSNAKYAGFVEQLDQMVGRITSTLDELDLTDNTVVIFTSDNGGINKRGFTNNAPLRSDKGAFYEGGIRVPFIVKWPNKVEAGTQTNQPIHIIDVFPTVAELIGGDISSVPQKLHGESLRELLTAEVNQLERTAIYWHFPGYMDVRNYPRSLIQKRVGEHTYKLFFDYATGRYEMYNISLDKGEENNLLESAANAHKAIALDMNKDLVEWLESQNAPTGTWRINGEPVPYPPLDMTSYKVPNQEGLKPLIDSDILRPWG